MRTLTTTEDTPKYNTGGTPPAPDAVPTPFTTTPPEAPVEAAQAPQDTEGLPGPDAGEDYYWMQRSLDNEQNLEAARLRELQLVRLLGAATDGDPGNQWRELAKGFLANPQPYILDFMLWHREASGVVGAAVEWARSGGDDACDLLRAAALKFAEDYPDAVPKTE